MKTQEQYNEWFKLMLSKHLKKHKYELSDKTHEGTAYVIATISHQDDKGKDIFISTYGRELTLFFWQHHEHHDSDEDDNHEEEFIDLCQYIDDIIGDEVFFAAGYRNGNASSFSAAYELEKLIDKKAEKKVIKSWSGKHDQVIENQELTN